MKLTVKNFGPIQEAEVDIKPMTVFVGSSNTGKSYMAMLIYTIFEGFERLKYREIMYPFLLADDREDVEKIISNDEEFAELANKLLVQFVQITRRYWKDEALRCFGEEWENITGKKKNPASVMISDDKNKIAMNFFSLEKDELPQIAPLLPEIKKQVRLHREKCRDVDSEYEDIPLSSLIMWQLFNLFNPLSSLQQYREFRTEGNREVTHYLPAARGGLMQSHRILVSSLIDRAPTIGLTGVEMVPFTGVTADLLTKLLNIGVIYKRFNAHPHSKRRIDEIQKLSEEIEQKIMRGEIKIKMSETRYPHFRYQFEDKDKATQDISLIYASSLVSELTPIVLFIRYYLSPGHVVVVEEPEAHLHPGAQRIIAGVLVELVNAGVNVIVTTHSDVILEQISNFIHADKIPQAKVLNKKAKGRTLSEDKSGIYWFKRQKSNNQTVVQTVPYDKETGILSDDHLDVSSDLYNETVDLFNARERNAEKSREK